MGGVSFDKQGPLSGALEPLAAQSKRVEYNREGYFACREVFVGG